MTGLIAIARSAALGEIVWKGEEGSMHRAFYRQVLMAGPGLAVSLDPSRVGDGLEPIGGAVGVHG